MVQIFIGMLRMRLTLLVWMFVNLVRRVQATLAGLHGSKAPGHGYLLCHCHQANEKLTSRKNKRNPQSFIYAIVKKCESSALDRKRAPQRANKGRQYIYMFTAPSLTMRDTGISPWGSSTFTAASMGLAQLYQAC
ncbi:hypothetical protein CEXT_641931 [Caerostris extrusa]|uniref:Secreted protein n=1 Tax=Caerostris extrusa TaxID=172846 RepID=A0AAV4NDI5_CAEEX|nr:hypothetical protein CEXT_641931 [Caerostris extrusa]